MRKWWTYYWSKHLFPLDGRVTHLFRPYFSIGVCGNSLEKQTGRKGISENGYYGDQVLTFFLSFRSQNM